MTTQAEKIRKLQITTAKNFPSGIGSQRKLVNAAPIQFGGRCKRAQSSTQRHEEP
jgi:RNA-splicing ligase RtcB